MNTKSPVELMAELIFDGNYEWKEDNSIKGELNSAPLAPFT